MSIQNLERIGNEAIETVNQAAAFIQRHSGRVDPGDVEKKSLNDLVSFVDKESEKILVKNLQKILPGSGFITEENTITQNNESELTWIIDPLDGTTNFLHGIPIYCVSVGLLNKGMLCAGIVLEINLQECFYSFGNNQSFLNGNKIQVSVVNQMSDSLIATGFPYTNYDRKHPYMDVFDYCMHNTRGLRRLGSAAADLAYVACGRFEAFWEYGLHAWDIAAGAFIVQNAGGKVCDFKGKDDYLFGQEIIATNATIHQPFTNLVKEKFNT